MLVIVIGIGTSFISRRSSFKDFGLCQAIKIWIEINIKFMAKVTVYITPLWSQMFHF